MFDREDPRLIWVSPDAEDGDGTFDQPFSSIGSALNKVEPGNTIVLKNGIYDEDVTVQISGTLERPIKIIADENATVEISASCWFFYDTSDLIVSGLTFKNAPHGAISVIGACQRNRFEKLHFVNCGTADASSCTMYFGGSSAECNIVENCIFISGKDPYKANVTSVALMVSEGNNESENTAIKNHIFRRNRFENYTHAILVGSNDVNVDLHGHIVEYNTISNCASDGIIVKCGDTQVRANLIKNCKMNAIKVAAGSSCVIENNRIENSLNGIAVNGSGHTVANNCISKCNNQAIFVCGDTDGQKTAATNLFIENNTCVDCGDIPSQGSAKISGILIGPGTTCVISNNLISGDGIPCYVVESTQAMGGVAAGQSAQVVITSNAASGSRGLLTGFDQVNVDYADYTEGNKIEGNPFCCENIECHIKCSYHHNPGSQYYGYFLCRLESEPF
jgi:parallel beta-helix repeat protein